MKKFYLQYNYQLGMKLVFISHLLVHSYLGLKINFFILISIFGA